MVQLHRLGLAIICQLCLTRCFNAQEFSESSPDTEENLRKLQQSNDRFKINKLTVTVDNFNVNSEFLASFPQLKQLFVFNKNYSPNVIVSQDAFAKSPQLEMISLERINRSETSLPTLNGLKNLVFLRLFDNDLRSPITGAQLENTSLTSIAISGSPRVTVSDNGFDGIANLESFNVNQCAQTTWPKSLASLRRLTMLAFSDCALETFSSEVIQNSRSSLITLNLSGNRLKDLDANAFKNMAHLSSLYLARNRLSVIYPEWFLDWKSLSVLDLSSNLIGALPSKVFAPLTNLMLLYVFNNSLVSLDDIGLESAQNTLVGLDASDNRINRIRMPKLTNSAVLDLRRNRIESIDRNCFVEDSHFKNVELDGNPIKQIANGAFRGLSFDGNFSVENTSLTSFSMDALDGIQLIYKFSLIKNPDLVQITPPSLSNLTLPPMLKEIIIDNNPRLQFDDPDGYFNRLSVEKGLIFQFRQQIKCDCYWLNRFLPSSKVFNLSNWKEASCSSSSKYVSEYISTINDSCANCQPANMGSFQPCSATSSVKSVLELLTVASFICWFIPFFH